MNECEFNIKIKGKPYKLTKNIDNYIVYDTPRPYDLEIKLNFKSYKFQSVSNFKWGLTNIEDDNVLIIENKDALRLYLNYLKQTQEDNIKTLAAEITRHDQIRNELDLLKKKAKSEDKSGSGEKLLNESKKIINKLKSKKYNRSKKTACVGVIQILGEATHESKIFVVRQKSNGKWMLPGGYLDPKDEEGIYSGLLREIKEETGIDISEYRPLFIDYKYFKATNKSLNVCVVHILLGLSISLKKINNLFEARTTYQNPSETDRWGYYNFHDKTIEKFKRHQLTPVINPEYRNDFIDNLSKVEDTCKLVDEYKLLI